MNFFDAKYYCEYFNASLASIHSEEENKFIHNFIKDNDRAIWLNGQQTEIKGSEIKWLDGSEFNYTNWNTLYAQPKGIEENFLNCIFLESYGLWYSRRCEDGLAHALCVKLNVTELKRKEDLKNKIMIEKQNRISLSNALISLLSNLITAVV
ncbi:lymphocyte antigen 75-like protein [Leptotrombidium deliense]|uniref:Lymphocyte antigen 75-like protein n=1 Tax=Leptotrombidium deliense TaxID=299467 RepID=A0A443RUD3_9ACAR|nr:lymphocyte antigen 75-like protein [Leptotrombidium deliense]